MTIERLPDPTALTISEEEHQEAVRISRENLPKVLPAGWKRDPRFERLSDGQGYSWVHRDGRSVILTAGLHGGKWWLHASIARRGQMPTYDDLRELKLFWIGGHRQAIQVFPPISKHINIHGTCLHLWACLEPEGDGLPDFGRAGTI